jgi:hypothetical protein
MNADSIVLVPVTDISPYILQDHKSDLNDTFVFKFGEAATALLNTTVQRGGARNQIDAKVSHMGPVSDENSGITNDWSCIPFQIIVSGRLHPTPDIEGTLALVVERFPDVDYESIATFQFTKQTTVAMTLLAAKVDAAKTSDVTAGGVPTSARGSAIDSSETRGSDCDSNELDSFECSETVPAQSKTSRALVRSAGRNPFKPMPTGLDRCNKGIHKSDYRNWVPIGHGRAGSREAKAKAKRGRGKLVKRGNRLELDCWSRAAQVAMYLYGETLPLAQIPLGPNSCFGHAEQFFIEQEHPLEKLKTDAGARYLLGQPDGVYITRLSLRYDGSDVFHIAVYYVRGTTRRLQDGGIRGSVYDIFADDLQEKGKAQRALRAFIGGGISSVRPLEVYKCL